MPVPIPRPGKIVCVGLNYRDHAAETGKPVPTEPVLFAKFANSVVPDGATVAIPAATQEVDWEAELGVVIGRRASRVGHREALDHVAGYTCMNDLSARDLQRSGGQWTRGKAIDGFLPMGPCLVTAAEVPDPSALAISCAVNGEVVQDSSTKEMVFGSRRAGQHHQPDHDPRARRLHRDRDAARGRHGPHATVVPRGGRRGRRGDRADRTTHDVPGLSIERPTHAKGQRLLELPWGGAPGTGLSDNSLGQGPSGSTEERCGVVTNGLLPIALIRTPSR